jgi:hypothetical protein
LTKELYWRQQ